MFLLNLTTLILGLITGHWFPDIDQRTHLLLHRSALTHGPLLSLLISWAASKTQWTPFRRASMGISLGTAVHLAFDLFPKAWRGFALISLPLLGHLPPHVSWAWIALSIALTLYTAARLIRNARETAVFLAAAAAIFIYAAPSEHAVWRPAAAITISTALILAATCIKSLTSTRQTPRHP